VNLIQRVPRGLLALFGARGSGENPTELLGTVQPIVNLEPMLSLEVLQIAQDTRSAIALSTDVIGSLTVPAGEVWRVLSIGYRASGFTTNGILHVGLRLQPPGAVASGRISRSQRFVATALNNVFDYGELFPQPLFLPAGSVLDGRLLENVTTGTVDTTLVCLFHRLLA